jgi:hypothetical protein
MHGVGCAVEFADHDVNFDLANRQDVGFDAWRLWSYATQFPVRYPHHQELKAVEAALVACLSEGTVCPVETWHGGLSNSRLLRLTDSLKSRQ